MNKIKFVYFDVGGVLLLDFTNTNKWNDLKKDLGVTSKNEELFNSIWQKHRNRICIDCDADSIIPEFKEKAGVIFPNGYSLLKDFIDRFEKNTSIHPVLDFMKRECKVGMLTNQYPRMLEEIIKRELIPNIKWDVIVDSSAIGYQKPDEKIFGIAEQEAKVKPEEILFVDNLSRNTEVAKQRGWQVFLYDDKNPEQASKELKKFYEKIFVLENLQE